VSRASIIPTVSEEAASSSYSTEAWLLHHQELVPPMIARGDLTDQAFVGW